MTRPSGSRWLFGPVVDIAVFGGSALFALGALAVGAAMGVLDDGTPDWAWIGAILLVDVAHVWATGFRVYFDRLELARRPTLYTLVPLISFTASVGLYSVSPALFWRTLAYLAIFHFVRQQYGWVALYRTRCGETDRAGSWLDALAIYAATIYPLLYWQTHLPRHFDWFVPGDVAGVPRWLERAGRPLYAALLGTYALRSGLAWLRGRGNPGKDIVVVTTTACWYIGIVLLDSDYGFTVTNVFTHGIPYFALVYFTRRRPEAARQGSTGSAAQVSNNSPFAGATRVARFLGTLWMIAFVEEMLWDRAVWQEHAWLFGSPWELGQTAKRVVVPLLALPQLTHYVLDAFLWRRQRNPALARTLRAEGALAPAQARTAL